MTEKQTYLDFNASMPLAPEVVEAMRPFLAEHFGNPSTTAALAARREAQEPRWEWFIIRHPCCCMCSACMRTVDWRRWRSA